VKGPAAGIGSGGWDASKALRTLQRVSGITIPLFETGAAEPEFAQSVMKTIAGNIARPGVWLPKAVMKVGAKMGAKGTLDHTSDGPLNHLRTAAKKNLEHLVRGSGVVGAPYATLAKQMSEIGTFESSSSVSNPRTGPSSAESSSGTPSSPNTRSSSARMNYLIGDNEESSSADFNSAMKGGNGEPSLPGDVPVRLDPESLLSMQTTQNNRPWMHASSSGDGSNESIPADSVPMPGKGTSNAHQDRNESNSSLNGNDAMQGPVEARIGVRTPTG